MEYVHHSGTVYNMEWLDHEAENNQCREVNYCCGWVGVYYAVIPG